MSGPRRLVTPAEAAEQLGADPKALARLAEEGRISGVRTPDGRRERYDEAEIAKFAAFMDAARKATEGGR